ncbi:MAG: chemotaxis protein CheW [Lachnospiraceae bacterium]|jgi:purine-binding chemotaxis protein CheW|nr:chemotaxis protein CheW [Lachnospiraceae bacterium]
MAYVKYLIFNIADRKYAMELVHVNGTEQNYSVIPIPDAPDNITGVVNLRGKIIPVYSLRGRFGLPTRIDNVNKSLMIVRSSSIMIGYEVDEVVNIEEIDTSDVNSMPQIATFGGSDAVFMNKVLRVGQGIVVVVDVNLVIPDEDIERLERLIEERSKEESTESESDEEQEASEADESVEE